MSSRLTPEQPQHRQPHAWYLVQCKPRQDERAEENLLRQGYTCYRPRHSRERLQQRCSAPAPSPLLESGDKVRLNTGPFAELEAIFLSMDGNERVVLLMNILHREQKVRVPLSSIQKAE